MHNAYCVLLSRLHILIVRPWVDFYNLSCSMIILMRTEWNATRSTIMPYVLVSRYSSDFSGVFKHIARLLWFVALKPRTPAEIDLTARFDKIWTKGHYQYRQCLKFKFTNKLYLSIAFVFSVFLILLPKLFT